MDDIYEVNGIKYKEVRDNYNDDFFCSECCFAMKISGAYTIYKCNRISALPVDCNIKKIHWEKVVS